MAQFTTNNHGNPQVLDQSGFVYSKHRTKNNWRCQKNSKKEGWSCKARVKTIISGNETHIVKYVGNHIHPPCFPPENPKEIDLESDYNKVKPLKI